MKCLLVLGGLLWLVTVSWAQSATSLNQAEQLIDQDQFQNAVRVLTQVIRSDPNHDRAYFLLGYARYGQERYQDAIINFLEAIRLAAGTVLEAEAYREIGNIYFAQQQYCESLAAARRFHQLASRLAVSQLIQEAQQLMDSLAVMMSTAGSACAASPQEKLYRLTIDTVPPDSSIRILNIDPKYHPGIRLPPQVYEIQVEKDGYRGEQRKIQIWNTDVTESIVLQSTTPHYKLIVRTEPQDSQVTFVDANLLYWPGMELPPGSYRIQVHKEGYQTAPLTISITNADIAMTVRLKPEVPRYRLTVQATPSDSHISILNIQPEYQPGIWLLPGQYDVEVRKDGYKTERQTVSIIDTDVTAPIMLKPEIKTYTLTVLTSPPNSKVELRNVKAEYRPGIELPMGRYDVLVSHEGYESRSKPVRIQNEDVTLEVALVPLPDRKRNVPLPQPEDKPGPVERGPSGSTPVYRLIINATPADSKIEVLNIEQTYHPGIALPPGLYDLQVSKKGYDKSRQWIRLKDQDVKLEIFLNKEPED